MDLNAKMPTHTRKFWDPEKLRTWVHENAKEAFSTKLNSIESKDYQLRVKDVELAEKDYTLQDQKKALLESKDLTTPLRGTFEMVNKSTGKVVDTKKVTIAQIPYVTDRMTTILNGSEYISSSQQRLKPGVYTRIRDSGEAEAHINVKPGTGLGGKMVFIPDTALFIYNIGTTQIKLYGLLKGLGLSDMEMEKAWGKEIFLKNKRAYKGDEIEKFYNKIFTFTR